MRCLRRMLWFFLAACPGWPCLAASLPPMDCVIEPNTVIDLSSAVDGVVAKIEVDRGDVVEQGQVVVRLDSGVEEAALEYARARADATAELKAGEANLAFVDRRRVRLETLYQQKVLSSDQMDETATEARVKQIQVQQAKETKRLAELDMRQASEILKRHIIRSPIRGVVVQRYLSPGESVVDKPILRLAQIDPLRAEVIIPVAYFGAVRVGQQAVLVPEAPNDHQYPAVVTVVDRVADAASGTFRARLNLPNADYSLPSGLRCTVQFLAPGQKADASLVVPAPRSLTRPPTTTAAAPGRVLAMPRPAATAASRAPSPARPPALSPVPKPAPAAVARAASPPPRIAAAPAPAPAPSCHTLGPITDSARVAVLRSQLTEYATRFSVRTDGATAVADYAVLSRPQASAAAASELVGKLKSAGIEDVAALTTGPAANRVSAGIYLGTRLAGLRRDALTTAGFDFEVRPRSKPSGKLWIDVQAPVDPVAFQHYARAIASAGPDLKAVVVPCQQQVAARN